MGTTRLAIYLVGLAVVVVAAWILLTQTPLGGIIPGGVAVALILLLVGIGVMASAKSINDSRVSRRVVHNNVGGPVAGTRTYDTRGPGYVERTTTTAAYDQPAVGETYVEDRRLE